MKKLFLLVVFILSFLLLSKEDVLAAKPRVRASGGGGGVGTAFSQVKLRGDRQAALVSLFNLSNMATISYSLTYSASGVEQSVQGTIDPAGQSAISREFLFGTCSKNVCTYHRNIKNMRLRFTATTKNGRTLVKGYLIKV